MTQILSSKDKPLTIQQTDILDKIDDKLHHSQNPLFFFHDDPDGVCSYLIFHHYLKEGKGICVKSKAIVDSRFLPSIRKYEPDTIFVLDLANISQDVLNYCSTHKITIVWIDHHDLHHKQDVIYYNPKMDATEINYPAALVSYEIIKRIIEKQGSHFNEHPRASAFLWLSVAGSIGDWHVPYTITSFRKTYPSLIPTDSEHPPEILFDTPLSDVIRFLSFALKGSTTKVNRNIDNLKKIIDPHEIIETSTEPAQKVHKNIQPFLESFWSLYNEVEEKMNTSDSRVFYYEYKSDILSVSSLVSNQLLYRFPDKIIIIVREKDDEIRGSVRSATVPIRNTLVKTLAHFNGNGGGHDFACGFSLKADEKDAFLKAFEENLFSDKSD
jgi:single-stranded DNA-specific DHH superfamily exonuclease